MADKTFVIDVDDNDAAVAEVLGVVRQVKPYGPKGVLRSDSNLVAAYGDKSVKANANVPALPILDKFLPDNWVDVALDNLDAEDRLRPWLLNVRSMKAALAENKSSTGGGKAK